MNSFVLFFNYNDFFTHGYNVGRYLFFFDLLKVNHFCCSSTSNAHPSWNHAIPFWEVSEEPCRDCEESEGECGILGEAGIIWKQEMWKGWSLFMSTSRCKYFSKSWTVTESEKLTVFPVGCRGSIKKSCVVERGAVWHWRQGASDWGSGSTGSRALQHQPPHFPHSKPTEDWFRGA